jgi:HEPN domain-containing protein
MFDTEKYVAYWRDGAKEDWVACQDLARLNRRRQALFFAHLTIEKLLKAHICHSTNSMPPRIHSLVRLAEIASLTPDSHQLEILAEINRFNLEGRYPEDIESMRVTKSDVQYYLKRAKEIYQWLRKKL